MAKLKVYELAKELDKQSKDILTLLQDKGIEVKSHMSVLEDSAVSIVKKELGGSGKSTVSSKTAETQAPVVEKVPAPALENVTEATAKTEEAPKKKKSIIFVSNPYNSKMPGGNTQRPMQQNTDRKPITPSVKQADEKPIQPVQPVQPIKEETVNQSVEPKAPVVEQPKVQPTIENKQTDSRPQSNSPQSGYNNSRPQGTGQGGYNNSRPQGTGQGGYNNSRPQGTGQGGYNSNPRPQGTGQGGYNSNPRPQGTGQGGYNSNPRPQGTGQGGYNSNPRPQGTGQGGYNSNPRPQGQGSYGQQGGYNSNPRPQGTGQGGYNSNPRPQGTGQGGYNSNPRPQGQGSYGQQGSYNNQGQRPSYGQNAQQGQTGQQGQRPPFRQGQTGGYNNNRPGGQSRPGGYGQQGGGYNNQGGGYNSQGGSRPYNNDGGAQRSNDGPGSRYGKPQGSKTDTPSREPEKHRDEAQRRLIAEKAQRNRRDHIFEEDAKVINKAGRFIRPEKKFEQIEEVIKVIILPESLTIKELAEKMKIQPSAIVKKLFLQGKIVTVNQEILYEQAEEIAIEYDIICEKEIVVDVIEELLKEEDEIEEIKTTRPPVICVMGHVDHGKTSLLDVIRKTSVTDKEAGGITQHIGAYTVNVNNHTITFLDTPGHEAFTSMRMRGANATDIAVLVVAADDGVMPQTIEAINHAKAAGIEIIVAVNKIDKPNANIDRVKQELAEYQLISEDWGGTTVFAPVSAKTGDGIPQLLEMIILSSEMLELKANSDRRARGLVIEAELDKGRGPVATVLVQKGTLHVGDFISAGASYGKVRAMIDDKGRRVKEATPSTPVEILGLSDTPKAGDVFISHENDKVAKNFAETFVAQNKVKLLDDTKAKMSLDDLFSQIKAGNLKELNLIVKADVQGSVEAVKQSLLKLSNEEVVVKIIHSGVGAINESDVILASASQAIIIGFNVRPDVMAKTTADREGVDVRLYKVIYQAIEDVKAAMKGMLDPIFEEKIIGHAEIRQIFKASAIGNIAGSYVLDGEFKRGCKVRITRQGTQIFEGKLDSLKRFKDDVKEVKTGFECGLVFEEFDQMQELDIVEAYMMVEVPR